LDGCDKLAPPSLSLPSTQESDALTSDPTEQQVHSSKQRSTSQRGSSDCMHFPPGKRYT